MQLHFGRRGRLTHLPPTLTQFLIATAVKIEFPVNHCKQTTEAISNHKKIRLPLPVALCASSHVGPIFRAVIFLLALPILAAPGSAQAPGPPTSSPAIYPSMNKVQSWIPMKDGTRLAVNLYMPEGANSADKFAAIRDYILYRKAARTLQ